METQTTNIGSIQKLEKIVQDMSHISEQIIYVMEEQIQAIISSTPEKIEELTEKQSDMQSEYKKHERAFMQELQNILSDSDSDNSLTELKNMFPAQKEQIEVWKVKLSQNTKRLQNKNKQLVELLQFALARNASLMHSYYSLFNKKNSHYNTSGQKADVQSGVAVNQEV